MRTKNAGNQTASVEREIKITFHVDDLSSELAKVRNQRGFRQAVRKEREQKEDLLVQMKCGLCHSEVKPWSLHKMKARVAVQGPLLCATGNPLTTMIVSSQGHYPHK